MNVICSAEFGRRYATRVCFCGCQTRAEARGYARLPLLRQDLSALADRERSPAIYRRVSVEKWIRRRVATVEPKGIASNSMNDICSAEFRRRYATRVCFCGYQTRAEARGYARLPLSRQRQIGNRKGVRLEAQIFRRLPLSRQDLSALADYERSPTIYRRVLIENDLSSRSDG